MRLLAGLRPDPLWELTALSPDSIAALGSEGKGSARRKGKGRVGEGMERKGSGERKGEESRGVDFSHGTVSNSTKPSKIVTKRLSCQYLSIAMCRNSFFTE